MTPARIIFIPGLKPKPPPDVYRRELLRLMLAALTRVRPEASRWFAEHSEAFAVVAWTYHFYNTHRDLDLDLPGIERLLQQPLPSLEDLREIRSWRRRLKRVWHIVGDAAPWLSRLMAHPELRVTLLEATRYLTDRDGIGATIRALLREELERAWAAGEEILLIGHSLGSVIAYDTLWELSHAPQASPGRVDTFITLGSPLATHFIRRALHGATAHGRARYPTNVRHWRNFSAKGDVTALHPRLTPFFHEMRDLGLIESIEDHVDLENHYRGNVGLNVHEIYGYLANSHVATAVGDWLLAHPAM